MNRLRGRTPFLGALAAIALLWFSVGAVNSAQDRSKVAKMTEKMKTVCVGRFLIDLPVAAEVSLSRAFIEGFDITTLSESEEQFSARVAARELEINSTRNALGRKNMEAVKEVRANGFSGKAFMYGRWRTYRIEGGKRKYSEGVALNGLVHSAGTTFIFATDRYDPARASNLVRLISQLRLLAANEIPTVPGFCIERAIFLNPLVAEQLERVVMFAGLPAHPDLAIVFSTMAGTAPAPGLLARNAGAAAAEPFFVRAAFTNLREGKRVINGLPGEELVMRVREPNFTTSFSFDWEMGGHPDDVFAPLLTLELQTGLKPYAGAKPVQSSLSEKPLLELWDKVSSSIRVRPSEPPKRAQVEPVLPPLGTYVSAGDTCPQSGWWRCSEGGNGVGVLGGQMQYLRKGQKMPQALLLPPQTLWEKVRGLQPSFESGTPTSWKLEDKRARARDASPVILAQPTAMPSSDGPGLGAVVAGDADAPIGSYVKTGAPCPASGWWRCEESHALDGTRWFAQGSLLPAATFKVPPGAFGRASGGPELIQRRSSWQLVRYAPGADLGKGNDEADTRRADVTAKEEGSDEPPHTSA